MTAEQGAVPMRGPRWRPAFSIITGVVWLAFLVIWLFFFAIDYTGFQNLAVIIVSVLVLALVNGLVWAIWGLQFAPEGAMRGQGWRVAISIITAIGWLIFLIIWLFFYASEFNLYQNLAVLIVSLLALAGINAAIWASWGMRNWGERW